MNKHKMELGLGEIIYQTGPLPYQQIMEALEERIKKDGHDKVLALLESGS